MSYLDRIAACHRWDPTGYRPFVVDDVRVGLVGHDVAERLGAYRDVFCIGEAEVALDPRLDDFKSRTQAVRDVLLQLREAGAIPRWRDEDYPVSRRWSDRPLMRVERGAAPLLGVRGFGVHVNGFVRRADGLHLWVGRRAKDKQTAPGKLDHLVAGGQPYGMSIRDNVIKEAGEEAGLAPEVAGLAVAVGAVSYRCERSEGLRDDVLFCYDLELPEEIVPVNTDGEVDFFELWPIDKVMERIRETEDFKFNVSLVILHFAIRHGILAPDDPDYQAICEGLHGTEPA